MGYSHISGKWLTDKLVPKNHLQKRVKVSPPLFCKFLMTCQNPPKVFNKEVQFTKQKVSFTTQQSNS